MPDAHPTRDPFALLGLPREFTLTRAQVESAYLQRAAAIHPDLSGLDPAAAARASSDLNHAKRSLLDPETRANALLDLIGGPGKSQDRSLPDGFLIQIMETRQQVEADLARIRESGDQSKRAEWEAWAENWRSGAIERVRELFTAANHNPDALVRIRTELNAWRYIERLIEQLDPGDNPCRADQHESTSRFRE